MMGAYTDDGCLPVPSIAAATVHSSSSSSSSSRVTLRVLRYTLQQQSKASWPARLQSLLMLSVQDYWVP
jgi:hypothetical protein